jgi:hypothetical protein
MKINFCLVQESRAPRGRSPCDNRVTVPPSRLSQLAFGCVCPRIFKLQGDGDERKNAYRKRLELAGGFGHTGFPVPS